VVDLLLLALLLCSLVYAQESLETPSSKVERKNRAPASGDILRVQLPKPRENLLSITSKENRRNARRSVSWSKECRVEL
jgi:hypothetical protein